VKVIRLLVQKDFLGVMEVASIFCIAVLQQKRDLFLPFIQLIPFLSVLIFDKLIA